MKTSIIQFRPEFANEHANTVKVDKILEQVKASDIVVLPELANTGYNFLNRQQAFSLAGRPEKSQFVEMLAQHAQKNKQIIVTGFHELSGDKLFNSSLMITEGGIVGTYRKVHLFMHEKEIFASGDLGFPVFDVNGLKLGMLICFDYLFPEAWRIMGLRGARIVLHPSNLITQNARIAIPAQAMTNRFFIITANRIGTERTVTFNGHSFITDPSGKVVAQLPHNKEDVLTYDVNVSMAEDKLITPLNHVFEDRFPDQYREIL